MKKILLRGTPLALVAVGSVVFVTTTGSRTGDGHAVGVAASIMSVVVCAALLVLRSARRIHKRQYRLLELLRENHKRASVWNFHVMTALRTSVPPRDGATVSASPPPRQVPWKGLTLFALAALSGTLSLASRGNIREVTLPLCLALVGVAVLDVVVGRIEERITGWQTRLEREVTANHKRASVWNYHVSKALGVNLDPPTSAQDAMKVSADEKSPTRVKRHPSALALVDSSVFDTDFYSAYAGGIFASPVDAASHYLFVAAPLGVSPTPFLDTGQIPREVARTLRNGEVDPLLTYLRSREALTSRHGALFDGRHAGIDEDVATSHPGGILGAWIAALDDEAQLAVAVDTSTRGQNAQLVREALIEQIRNVRKSEIIAGPRSHPTWDSETEASWLGELARLEMGKLPRVTVVMAVRDREDIVGRAIRSVQAQTHEHWELVVVDDGSADDTCGRVSELAAKDPRIRLVQGVGRGVAHARNLGLQVADGDYLAYIDSDNEWVDTYLETMLRGMISEKIGAAYAATAIRGGQGTRYRAYVGGLDHLLTLNHIDLNVLMIRADVAKAAGEFDESLKRWVDHDYAIRVAKVDEPRLFPFIGCWYDDSREATDRITVRESEHWQWVVLAKHWVDWESVPEPVSGRLSVIIPTYNDFTMTKTAICSVLSDASDSGIDIEVVVVDNGSKLEVGQDLIKTFGVGGPVRYLRLPRNLHFATGCNLGLSVATGEWVLFLNNDTEVRRGALSRLQGAMSDPHVLGVQPLLVYPDETIQTAGTVFAVANALPNHLLVGHPPADALPLERARFDAISAAAMMVRSSQVRALRGFDPIYVNGMEDVDLCLRLSERYGGHFALEPTAIVTHLESRTPGRGNNVLENRRLFLNRWKGRLPAPQQDIIRHAGFELSAIGTDGLDVPGPKLYLRRDPADTRLRWGIRISSAAGSGGDTWGDTHFAESLRAALERAGHNAVVHRPESYGTPATAFDDVNLVIRGKARVRPMPGKTNMLWVISHPDDVTLDELREFEFVFAASSSWSQTMSERSGRAVHTMLQATDADRFRPDVEAKDRESRAVFVGSTHPGRNRLAVHYALESGVDLRVYGRGWASTLPGTMLAGEYIDNAKLAAYYKGAARVVTDHWENMALAGFVQNRVFDAVASGARVVCDDVDGLAELFGGSVQVYTTPEELAYLCSDKSDHLYPSDEERHVIAERVRREHSFEARALEISSLLANCQHRDLRCESFGFGMQSNGAGTK